MDPALDSIIDAIESNHLKEALKLSEKFLKKWPGNLQLLSLKSLALWYSGIEDQAIVLATNVSRNNPLDYFTISIIERVLEASDNCDQLASVCEASLKNIYDARIAEKLFTTYLKLHDTKKLFPIAIKLFNVSKSDSYLYWAVIGLLLDFRYHEGPEAKLISELAKRTFEKIKLPADSKLLSEYKTLMIQVNRICDYDVGVLTALNIKTRNDSSDMAIDKIETLIRCGNYFEAKSLCVSLFDSERTIDSKLWGHIINLSRNLENGLQFALGLFNQLKSSALVRELEAARVELKLTYENSFSETISEMVYLYATSLRSKPSTLNDVIFFLKKMNIEDVEIFYSIISKEISLWVDAETIKDKSILLHLHRFLTLTFGFHFTIPNEQSQLLLNIYSKMEAENFFDDSYYLLGLYRCLCLIDSYPIANDNEAISRIVSTLELYTISFKDKYIFQMIQTVMFLKTGLIHSAHRSFKRLEIKSLQLDTLGYLLLDHSLCLCALSVCERVCFESSSLYSSNRRDTWGLICQSLEDHSFGSVIDFYEFYIRLEKSIQNISVETNILKLKISNLSVDDFINFCSSSKCDRIAKVLSYSFGHIFDNRDFDIFDTIDPAGRLKNNLSSLNSFTLQEAMFYYYFIQKIRSFQNFESTFQISGKIFSEKYSVLLNFYTNFTGQSSDICKFYDEIHFKFTASLKSSENLTYELLVASSDFLLNFKEILVLLKLFMNQAGETESTVFELLDYLKSQILLAHGILCSFLESKSNYTEEQTSISQNLNDWFNLLIHDSIFRQ